MASAHEKRTCMRGEYKAVTRILPSSVNFLLFFTFQKEKGLESKIPLPYLTTFHSSFTYTKEKEKHKTYGTILFRSRRKLHPVLLPHGTSTRSYKSYSFAF